VSTLLLNTVTPSSLDSSISVGNALMVGIQVVTLLWRSSMLVSDQLLLVRPFSVYITLTWAGSSEQDSVTNHCISITENAGFPSSFTLMCYM